MKEKDRSGVSMKNVKTISGNIVDVCHGKIFAGTISFSEGKIVHVQEDNKKYAQYILPGFVDAHIHIESSMLVPAEFARVAVQHGTVATVSDPHEIANVLGIEGVNFMIKNAAQVPFKFYFGASSCVPATTFETSGATIDAQAVEKLLKQDTIKYLAEVMNFPGVVHDFPDIMQKIKVAQKYGKKIDGHAPTLTGKDLKKYVAAGITTDHECITLAEAKEKISLGMKIQIREGSASKDFDTFYSLVGTNPNMCMFCSDDKHPDDLETGHINLLVKRCLAKGLDLMRVLKVACVNPVEHYGLDVGLLQKGDNADFIVVDDLKNLEVLKTFINGVLVAEKHKSLIPRTIVEAVNNFKAKKKKVLDFALPLKDDAEIEVIKVIDGQLFTERNNVKPKLDSEHNVIADLERDLLKIVVVNRYEDKAPAVAFMQGFGFKEGAIASSVAHDSHNIVAVGVNDELITTAVNLVIEHKGGIAAVTANKAEILPLPVAGLMSVEDYKTAAAEYTKLNKMAKKMGTVLHAPFMSLSFMALLVIPRLKLSDKGLFDGEKFKFV